MPTISDSANAPEIIRALVNVAGSIAVSRKARRHRIEFAAKASSASEVSVNRRNGDTLPLALRVISCARAGANTLP